MPVSSWTRMSRGVSGTWPVSQEAPHTLFSVCQAVLGPLIWTVLIDPLLAASCAPPHSPLQLTAELFLMYTSE